jgi:SAM-dependent methyltransferase
MRITYRDNGVKDYWISRWSSISVDQPMENTQVYPLKYAEQIVKDWNGKILEAGCGAGRILRYYHNKGMDIVGIDFIEVVVEKLKQVDSTLKVEVGDITNLHFDNESFKYIFSFGLYHNLEYKLDKAIKETYRVLESGGYICASFRADNIHTRLTDWIFEHSARGVKRRSKSYSFHKMNLTRSEFKLAFEKAGFNVDSIIPVENMPILYKFSLFRASSHKRFDENVARVEGYKLSFIGEFLHSILMYFAPNQFCSIYLLIANKK